jgi:predicted cobalt transporter CbtA
MSTTKRDGTVGIYAGFYWLGTVMTLACLALIVAGNTELLYRVEHTRFPLSWALAGIAVLAFVAAELCHPPDAPVAEAEDGSPQLTPEWEAVEA